MKSARPQPTETSAREQGDFITTDSLKARLQAGEIIGATDYDESIRAQFWAAVARVRDDLPCVRACWRTIGEQHVNGIRTRQRMFKIFPRQQGGADPTLISLIALAATCLALICARWPL